MRINEVLEMAGVEFERVKRLKISTKRKRAVIFLKNCENGCCAKEIRICWNSMKKVTKKQLLE